MYRLSMPVAVPFPALTLTSKNCSSQQFVPLASTPVFLRVQLHRNQPWQMPAKCGTKAWDIPWLTFSENIFLRLKSQSGVSNNKHLNCRLTCRVAAIATKIPANHPCHPCFCGEYPCALLVKARLYTRPTSLEQIRTMWKWVCSQESQYLSWWKTPLRASCWGVWMFCMFLPLSHLWSRTLEHESACGTVSYMSGLLPQNMADELQSYQAMLLPTLCLLERVHQANPKRRISCACESSMSKSGGNCWKTP